MPGSPAFPAKHDIAQLSHFILITPAHRGLNLKAPAQHIPSIYHRVRPDLRTACALRKDCCALAQAFAQDFPSAHLMNIELLARTKPDFGVRPGNVFGVASPQ